MSMSRRRLPKGCENMVVRFYRHSVILCVCILAAAVAVTMAVNFGRSEAAAVPVSGSSGASSPAFGAGEASAVPNTASNAEDGEMRAVWVPYLSLDMSREDDKSEKAFQKKFDAIVGNAKSCGMNTLIVQVRPFGDALYKSSYFPWSHIVGGTQGVNPGYDPLTDMVSACHKAGLKLHAWVNPLRIQTTGTPSILATDNPYSVWQGDAAKAGWTVDWQGAKYYNPAYEQVRRLIADGVQEIAANYDVDGIQIDDYFYPTQDAAFDKAAYDAYSASASKTGSPLPLAEWRRGNVNALVSLVYREVKETKPELPFGISPQGNVQNDLDLGADVAIWCSVKGYADYLCPQLYVNFENPTLPFDSAVRTWRNMVTNPDIKLYLGLAVYKAGSDADSGTWKNSGDILARQVTLGRETSCDGFMFYSCDYLNRSQTKEEVQNVVRLLTG